MVGVLVVGWFVGDKVGSAVVGDVVVGGRVGIVGDMDGVKVVGV